VRKTLLIVEDSDLNRDLLVQIFEDAYDIEEASDGETAVELALTKPPDLILMDIGLPGLSGLDAVRAIRAGAAGIPIVAVSSGVMPGDRERALSAGCDDFVAKPIDDLMLVEMVARLLEWR
jgi:two-component system, cell cycle response regulator DivK